MSKLYQKVLYHTYLGQSSHRFYDRFRSWIVPDKVKIENNHARKLGAKPDLTHPSSFNEKICWLKLNDRTPLHTQCADKYEVRSYVSEKIGSDYLIPLLMHTADSNDLRPESLPEAPFIIKTNHGSGGAVIVTDKKSVSWADVRKNFKLQLKSNYYYLKREWQYKNIKPLIVVERLLLDAQGEIPMDYKFHVFNGKVGFIQVDLDRSLAHKRNIYDPSWELLDCEYEYPRGGTVAKPAKLEEMIRLAEILGGHFIFARVDFYFVDEAIYFGEITFHPESGNGKFAPDKWDHLFGEKLKLPID